MNLVTYAQSAGTFDCGAGQIGVVSNNGFTLNGGRFNCTNASIDSPSGVFNLNGGTFDMPSGTFTLGNAGGASTISRGPSATLNHNNGTLVLNQAILRFNNNSGTQDVFNVVANLATSGVSGTLRVLGTLDLQRGTITGPGNVEVLGNLSVANTYAGGGGGGAKLDILEAPSTPLPRTITLPTGMPTPFQPFRLNAPNTTITTSGAGAITLPIVELQAGTIDTGASDVTFSQGGLNSLFNQSGGTFSGGTGVHAFSSTLFTLSGGIFTASNATSTFSNLNFNQTGGTFDPNGGTVELTGGVATFDVPSAIKFFNLTSRLQAGLLFAVNDRIDVDGDLDITDGSFSNNSTAVNVKGNVTVGAAADGGAANIRFVGSGNQTFTNNGGANPGSPAGGGISWLIDKPSGIVTAATSLILPTNISLNISSGTLYLNENSNLTTGALTIGGGGKLVSESATTITLGGNLVNAGVVDLQGGGAVCDETPGVDPIVIRSSDATQRAWSGGGIYRLVDVNVSNMGGSTAAPNTLKRVFSGSGSGTNPSWIFNAGCPEAVSITPTSAGVQTGQTRQFTAGGTFTPLAFSLATNNSGGAINAATGLYTAGATPGVSDTIRVTDAFGATADATVSTFGAPSKVVFTAQPATTVAGQTMASVTVAIQDAFGNTVTNSSAPVALALANNPNGGTLGGTTPQNTVNGVATFGDLSIARAANGYSLRATSGSLTAAVSDPFNIEVGAPTELRFIVQPSDTNEIAAINPPVKVAITDSFGNVATNQSGQIALALDANPSGGTLSGTLSKAAVAGVATFGNLSIDNAGVGYTLIATSGAFTGAASNAFNIVPPFVVTNTNDSGTGSLRQAILNANAIAGQETISFNIAGPGTHKIAPLSQLPEIQSVVTIDGTTQPGFSGNPVIELSGENISSPLAPGNGLQFGSLGDRSAVRGLAINRFKTSGLASVFAGVTIEGNYIGTDVTGTIARPNAIGIVIAQCLNTCSGNLINGNIISGNSGDGITLSTNARNTVITSNRIGLSAADTALVNAGSGISSNVATSLNNRISANRIASGRRGIALNFNNAPLPNDVSDVDTGANNLQNYPVLTSATATGANTSVTGTFNSEPSKTYRLEFFSSPTCHSGDFGNGEKYLGFANLTTDTAGIASLNVNLSAATTVGHVLTATATDPDGNTSEFSQCRAIAPVIFSATGTILDNNGNPMPNVIVNVQGTLMRTTTDSNGVYRFFHLNGGGNYTIVPTSTNFSFSPANRILNNLSANQSNQDFVGTRLAMISGKVNLAGRIDAPLSGVAIELSGAASSSATTDSNGNYSFPNLPDGNYTLSASREGLQFSVSPISVVISGASQTVNFQATEPVSDGRLYFGADALESSTVFDYGRTVLARQYASAGSSVPIKLQTVRPVFDVSTDGTKLVMAVLFNGDLVTANYDGTDARAVMNCRCASPAWSPNADRIAFLTRSFPSGGNSQATSSIVIVNADGSNPLTVFTTVPGRLIDSLDWSPDGTKLLFSEFAAGVSNAGTDIRILVLGSSTPSTIATSQLTTSRPAFSPDGTKIAIANKIGTNFDVVLMNSDGSNPTVFLEDSRPIIGGPLWAPDGRHIFVAVFGAQTSSSIFFVELIKSVEFGTTYQLFETTENKGAVRLNGVWGAEAKLETSAGSNVEVSAGGASVSFSAVNSGGSTTFTPFSPTSTTAPTGYVLADRAYDISTTANVTAPITVCFAVASNTSLSVFNQLNIMHYEGGTLVNRTSSRDFATKKICATTNSLSPFVLAEQIDSNLPSISGIAVDSNGDPMVGVSMTLTGADEKTTVTDSDGVFRFVNLTPNGNYNVSPKQIGYLFDEYNTNFVNVTGEETVVFTGTQSNFAISGKVTDGVGNGVGGVTMTLDGDAQTSVATDGGGNYSFTNLPADGSYLIRPSNGTNPFSPLEATVDALTSDAAGIDFQMFAPTAATVGVGGRLMTSRGTAIGGVTVSISGGSLSESRSVRSNSFGYYRFDGLEAGQTYALTVTSRRYDFTTPTRVVSLQDDISDADFTGDEQ